MMPVDSYSTGALAERQDALGAPRTMTLQERHDMRKGWFMAEAFRQAPNRLRMAKCEQMYDGDQYEYQEAKEIEARGQNPVVRNEIKPTIDWLIGTERRTRIDFVVISDSDDIGADEDAAIKTKLLKYLDDSNMAVFERSYAAEDAWKAGVGWLEIGMRGDQTGVPVYVGSVPWRNILWDSMANRRDLEDARYLFRIKIVDLDIAIALFPHCEDKLRAVAQTGDSWRMFSEFLGLGSSVLAGLDAFTGIDDPLDAVTARPLDMYNCRERVMLLECWSREPVPGAFKSGGLADPLQMRMHVAIMTELDTLLEGPSPFKHDRFPFIPIWAYRNRRTGLPYSPIWPLIGPQVSLNHRMSKSLYEASANRMALEKSAINSEVMTLDELRAEFNSPDGALVLADGALSGGRWKSLENPSAAQHQLLLAQQDVQTIRQMSGVTGENRGLDTTAHSGKAILAKQDQGSLLTAELFDNLLLARKMEGEITLSMVEQCLLAPMSFRTAEDGNGKPERVSINQPMPDGTYLNDISARRTHFVVGEQAWKQAYAEASFESLMQVFSQLAPAAPQIVINILDLLFEMHPTLPKKRAIVSRIRALNGQADPDGKMTPEQQAEQAQKAAIAKAQFEMQMAQMQADVAKAQATGAKLNADAVKARLASILDAANAAVQMAQVSEIVPIADELLKSSGFKDVAVQEQILDMQQQEMAVAEAAAAEEAAMMEQQGAPPRGAEPMPAEGVM